MIAFYVSFYLPPEKTLPKLTNESANPRSDTEVLSNSINSKHPIRLKIPSIQINADVQDVGIASDGTMEVPNDSAEVGWYNLGPFPGDKGSAVIAGHIDGENGAEGVFTNLHLLKPGDKISVEDANGTYTNFVVRESRIYHPYEDSSSVYGQSEGHHLNLITCFGPWNDIQNSYAKRLVVFADII